MAEEAPNTERTYNNFLPDKTGLPFNKQLKELNPIELWSLVSFYDESMSTLTRFYLGIAPFPVVAGVVLMMFTPSWYILSMVGIFSLLTLEYVWFYSRYSKKRKKIDDYRDSILIEESKRFLELQRAKRSKRKMNTVPGSRKTFVE